VKTGVQLLPHILQYRNQCESKNTELPTQNQKIGQSIEKRHPQSQRSVNTNLSTDRSSRTQESVKKERYLRCSLYHVASLDHWIFYYCLDLFV